MPRHRITEAAGRLIATLSGQGKPSRTIAERLSSDLGVTLDQRTISRYLRKLGPRTTARATKPSARKPVRPKGRTTGPILSEVEALQREVVTLQGLLDGDLPPRDRAAVTAELRGCFKAIRTANQAAQDAQAARDDDVQFVLARLRRFDALNEQVATEFEGVPEAARAAGSE